MICSFPHSLVALFQIKKLNAGFLKEIISGIEKFNLYSGSKKTSAK